MSVEWICERCGTRSDVTGLAPGEPFKCPQCGRSGVVTGTPAEHDAAEARSTAALGKRIARWTIGATLFAALAVLGGVKFAMVAQARNKAAEPRFLLQRLCTNVRETHAQTGEWVAAGPEPKTIPGKDKVEFPVDPQFEKLGFAPGMVRYQYQVIVDGDPVGTATIRCIARGDLNGDGITSEGEVLLDAKQMPTEIHWQRELE